MFWSKEPKAEKLFGSWPPTEIKKDRVKIRADFFTPEGKDKSEAFQGFLGLGGAVLGFLASQQEGQNPLIGIVVGGALGAWIGHQMKSNFKKTLNLEFTPEFIRVPSGWSYKNYDLKLPHGFNKELHEKAQEEQEAEEDERYKKGRTHRREKTYRNSYHVYMEFFGERVYLADVYEKKIAEALLVRLQGVDKFVKELEQSGTGEPGIIDAPEIPKDKSSPFGERPALDD